MSFATERSVLSAPLSALATPISWPGREFNPPTFTGDRSNPAEWIEFDVTYPGSRYLTFGGVRHLFGNVEISLFMEPIVGDGLMRQRIDSLESAYTGQDDDTYTFRVQESVPTVFGVDGAWYRWDWKLPFWRIE